MENVDWLIAEVEKYQTLNSQQIDPYAQGQEETANRCAWLAGQTSKVAEHKIRLEFDL